jgi:uncharacterized membrane protein YdbT with pleckstrin-like domain
VRADRLLDEGEHVILAMHPHWRRLLPPALLLPALTGATSYAVFLVPAGSWQLPLRWATVGVAVLLALRWCLWPWLVWRSTDYVLTDRRVVTRSGVLSRRGRDLLLARINDVSFHRTLAERLIGAGTLTIETAADQGRVVLVDVPSVELLHRQIQSRLAGPDREARH